MRARKIIERVLDEVCEGYDKGAPDTILSALDEEGLVIAPKVPTRAMNLSGFDEYNRNPNGQVSDLYMAMLKSWQVLEE